MLMVSRLGRCTLIYSVIGRKSFENKLFVKTKLHSYINGEQSTWYILVKHSYRTLFSFHIKQLQNKTVSRFKKKTCYRKTLYLTEKYRVCNKYNLSVTGVVKISRKKRSKDLIGEIIWIVHIDVVLNPKFTKWVDARNLT